LEHGVISRRFVLLGLPAAGLSFRVGAWAIDLSRASDAPFSLA
jgi:hypothetical protein